MFDKKYIAGIASFSGIAMNNIKADAGIQKVHIKVGDNVYYKDGDGHINMKGVKDFNALCNFIKSFTAAVKQGDSTGKTFDFSKFYEDYFVKKVKVSGDETNKLSDDLKIDLSAVSADVEITLVPKRKCIEFEYTSDKKLRKEIEDMLLKTVIQGNKLSTINVVGISNFGNSTLNKKVVENGNEIIGSQVKVLDETNKIKFKIDSDKFGGGYCKSVVCKFNNDVKLVDGINLEDLYNLDLTGIVVNNLSFEVVSNKLKTVNASVGTDSAAFLSGNFGFTVINGNSNITIKKSEDNKKFDDADFIVLDDIKAADINPLFLKKNFSVEFDKGDDNTKKVDDEILDKIKNSLNKELSDKVVIKVSDIIEEIKKVNNGNPNDIIITNAFNTLNNISIEGVGNVKPNTLGLEDVVNSKEIKINLKEGVFAKGIVKTEFNFYVNFDAVKKGGKDLNSDIVEIINNLKGTIKVLEEELEIECFLNDVNAELKEYFLDGKSLDETDFDFLACKKDKNDSNLNRSGTIKARESIVSKLKDTCFATTQSQEEENGGNKSTNTSNGSGEGTSGGKKSEKKCCNSGKNQ